MRSPDPTISTIASAAVQCVTRTTQWWRGPGFMAPSISPRASPGFPLRAGRVRPLARDHEELGAVHCVAPVLLGEAEVEADAERGIDRLRALADARAHAPSAADQVRRLGHRREQVCLVVRHRRATIRLRE